MDFLKFYPTAARKAAPHLDAIDTRSKYSITIDLSPVNAATRPEQWPMPIIEVELSSFVESKHFAFLEIFSSYRQRPLDSKSSDACEITAPTNILSPPEFCKNLKTPPHIFSPLHHPCLIARSMRSKPGLMASPFYRPQHQSFWGFPKNFCHLR